MNEHPTKTALEAMSNEELHERLREAWAEVRTAMADGDTNAAEEPAARHQLISDVIRVKMAEDPKFNW